MAKSKDLKSRLKASDRRRRRRPEQPAPRPSTPPPASVDVTGLLVEAILIDRTVANDSTVVAALRGCKVGSVPQHQDARRLYARFQEISEREDVPQRGFVAAIDQLMNLASRHVRGSDQVDNPFVSYLALLAT